MREKNKILELWGREVTTFGVPGTFNNPEPRVGKGSEGKRQVYEAGTKPATRLPKAGARQREGEKKVAENWHVGGSRD